MMYGKVLRPPSFGATLESCDRTDAQKLPGVVVVRDGDFVGAAASSESDAEKAMAAIRAKWKETPQPSSEELFSYLKLNVESGDHGAVTQPARLRMVLRARRIACNQRTPSRILRMRHSSRALPWRSGKKES